GKPTMRSSLYVPHGGFGNSGRLGACLALEMQRAFEAVEHRVEGGIGKTMPVERRGLADGRVLIARHEAAVEDVRGRALHGPTDREIERPALHAVEPGRSIIGDDPDVDASSASCRATICAARIQSD